MLYIGSHVGFKKNTQLLGSLEEALSYQENTFMFYTGAPQNTARYPIDRKLTEEAWEKMKEQGMELSKVIVHAPYIVNLANDKDMDKFRFSVRFLEEELKRCSELGISYMVLHPGSHVGAGMDVGIEWIINGLNEVLDHDDTEVKIALETMAGKGNECGFTFEQLAKIYAGIHEKSRGDYCMDTCHIWDAGYDITHFDEVLDQFDSILGLENLLCMHINDSKNPLGAHKDRHENLGKGYIGFDVLHSIVHHPKLEHVTKILETPFIDGKAPYKEEISALR